MLNLGDPSLLDSSAYIDGAWVGADWRTSVRNPANGGIVAEVPDVGVAGARAAIDAAQRSGRLGCANCARARRSCSRTPSRREQGS